MNDEAHIIVGALIEKDGKYLLVQELKKKCYMQWNLPLGHLDAGETVTEGAMRETKEETGYDVKLTKLIDIQNHYGEDSYVFVKFTYLGEIIGGDPSEIQTDEINDVKWFTHDELKSMHEEGKLRGGTAILHSVEMFEQGAFLPVDTVKVIKRPAKL
ncbi:MAG: NUDIX domain-containing protein [Candidatus Saccharimonadales bacterium]